MGQTQSYCAENQKLLTVIVIAVIINIITRGPEFDGVKDSIIQPRAFG